MKADLSNAVIFTALCKSSGFPAPVFEYQFHPTRKWRFDVAWPEWFLALEWEGLLYGGGGRHQRIQGFTGDCVKYNQAAILGWKVLRYPQNLQDACIDDLTQIFRP